MLGQYALMHKHALGNFADLLQGMSKDPAMMVWLDTVQSKKGMPNENYARELMELFALGIGHYTEKDVREAARAFTGWEVRDGKFFADKAQFDATNKTVLGKTGNFAGDDVVKICLDQKACPRFIARKLYRFLISESDTPDAALIDPLAEAFAKDYDFGKLVGRVLRSNLFFSDAAYRACVKSPVDFVVGTVKALEAKVGPSNGSLNLQKSLEVLGQNPFHPPSVKGWDGGETWLNGQTLLARQNLALDLVRKPAGYGRPAFAAGLAAARKKASDAELVEFFLDLFLQGDVPAESRTASPNTSARPRTPSTRPTGARDGGGTPRRDAGHLVLTLPEYQLN